MQLLAMLVSLGGLVEIVVTLIVAGLIFWLLLWLINFCGVPEPFNKIARVVLAIAAVIVVIGCLLALIGVHPVQLGP